MEDKQLTPEQEFIRVVSAFSAKYHSKAHSEATKRGVAAAKARKAAQNESQ